jgi:hypothetical protein
MKEIKTGDRQKKKTSYPCMKMKISKGGWRKQNKKNIMSLCKNKRNKKRGQTKEKILSLYENENLKRGDRKKQQKHMMSL